MAFVFKSIPANCQFLPTLSGIGNFIVASAAVGKQTPAQSGAANAKVYAYYAQSLDGSQWESGSGAYNTGTSTLARTTITSNSDGTLVPVNFLTIPLVAVFSNGPAVLDQPVQTGTLMLFQQSVAPVGWTKQTTHNDKALRVVSGTASSGGTNAFSTVMAQTTVGNHTLSIAEMPAHGDHVSGTSPLGSCSAVFNTSVGNFPLGGGTAHTHPITLAIQYVDLIICQKN